MQLWFRCYRTRFDDVVPLPPTKPKDDPDAVVSGETEATHRGMGTEIGGWG